MLIQGKSMTIPFYIRVVCDIIYKSNLYYSQHQCDEPRDKWAQIECLHSILCLWGPLNHEEVAIFRRKMSEF